MTTADIRKRFKVTQKELSELFNIPLGTIKNWDARDCMPEYMSTMIENTLVLRKLCLKYWDEECKFNNHINILVASNDVIHAAMDMTKVSHD